MRKERIESSFPLAKASMGFLGRLSIAMYIAACY